MAVITVNNSDTGEIPDSVVIRRILGGEKQLYELLVKRNNQKLYRVIRGYLKDEAEIEDIMQNTYLKAYEKLYQFKEVATFSTWMIRIGINEALFRLKEKRKLALVNDLSYSFAPKQILEMQDYTQLDPEREIIRKEEKQLLEAIIDTLEPKYRSVYILREVEEMNIKEISASLSISISNVKVRLHRAKTMLKEKLHEPIHSHGLFEFGNSRCDRITEFVMKAIL